MRIGRMSLKFSKREAWLFLFLAATVNILIVYGFIARPVISFHLTTPLEYNGTLDMGTEDLVVGLEATNLGRGPARVTFYVSLYNMSLTGPEGLEITEYEAATVVQVPVNEVVSPSDTVDRTITLTTEGDATHLVFIFSVNPKRSGDPLSGFFNSFAIYEPVRPTALLLKHLESGEYQRVTSR